MLGVAAHPNSRQGLHDWLAVVLAELRTLRRLVRTWVFVALAAGLTGSVFVFHSYFHGIGGGVSRYSMLPRFMWSDINNYALWLLLNVELPEPLAAGSSATLKLQAAGLPDADFAYFDSTLDWRLQSSRNQILRLGTEGARPPRKRHRRHGPPDVRHPDESHRTTGVSARQVAGRPLVRWRGECTPPAPCGQRMMASAASRVRARIAPAPCRPLARLRRIDAASGDVRGPVGHQPAPAVEQVAAPVGGFHAVAVDMG